MKIPNLRFILTSSLIIILILFTYVAINQTLLSASKPLKKRDIARLHHVKGALQNARINGISKNLKKLCGREEYNPYIKFSGDSRVSGSICCNEFSGNYVIEPNTNSIKFGELIMTSVGCLETPQDDFDILGIIQNLNTIEFKDSALTLSSNYYVNMFVYEVVKESSFNSAASEVIIK